MSTVLGKKRLPMLIIDQNPTIFKIDLFLMHVSAAIFGFSIFGTKHSIPFK